MKPTTVPIATAIGTVEISLAIPADIDGVLELDIRVMQITASG
ncbi:MAG: hypothetical protein WA993_15570 [Candidatus Binatus sp.]|jgi:hypothetical protein